MQPGAAAAAAADNADTDANTDDGADNDSGTDAAGVWPPGRACVKRSCQPDVWAAA